MTNLSMADLRAANLRDRRERIATAVMQGLLSNHRREGSISEAAEISIKYADALIAELDREPQP